MIYVDPDGGRFGLTLYTASSDAEGTLGGLVGQARETEAHLAVALRTGALCSNDPVCAQHAPGEGMAGRHLHGAACHGCALISETHELLAATLEHVLRTFGAPPNPNRRPAAR